ncbi:MAG: MYXO-CTERM sorting domain-containing protein [Rubrivivax sp.]
MKRSLTSLLLAGLVGGVLATPLTPTHYDMPNGTGRATGGNYDEVQFDANAVPLPGTLALASVALLALRRRR